MPHKKNRKYMKFSTSTIDAIVFQKNQFSISWNNISLFTYKFETFLLAFSKYCTNETDEMREISFALFFRDSRKKILDFTVVEQVVSVMWHQIKLVNVVSDDKTFFLATETIVKFFHITVDRRHLQFLTHCGNYELN